MCDVGVQGPELAHEVLVAAVDEVDALDPAGALGRQGGDEVGEAAAQVGHDDVRPAQGVGPGDDRRVVEVALAEAAGGASQALAVDLDGGTSLDRKSVVRERV